MILETYQEEQAIKPQEETTTAYATVTAVTEEGIKVKFDGEEEESTKAFPCNTGVSFSANDRVLMQKINGTYIVMMPVGKTSGGGSGSIKRYTTSIERNWNGGTFTSWSVTAPVSNVLGVVDVFSDNGKVMANFGLIPNSNIIYMLVWNPSSAVNSKINYTILYKE